MIHSVTTACVHLGSPEVDHPPHMCGIPRCHHTDGPHKAWECTERTVIPVLGCPHQGVAAPAHRVQDCPARVPMGEPVRILRRTEPEWKPPARPVPRVAPGVRELPPVQHARLARPEEIPANVPKGAKLIMFAAGYPGGDAALQARCRACGKVKRLTQNGEIWGHGACKERRPVPGSAEPILSTSIVARGNGWVAVWEDRKFKYAYVKPRRKLKGITELKEWINAQAMD